MTALGNCRHCLHTTQTGFLAWSEYSHLWKFFIFGMGMFIQVCIVTATVTSCLFVWDKHNLNFHGWTFFFFYLPLTITTSTCMSLWDWFVDLLAEEKISISLNTCLTSTFRIENVFLSKIWRPTAVYYVASWNLAGQICIKLANGIIQHQTFPVSIQPQMDHRDMPIAPVVLCAMVCFSWRGKKMYYR